MSTPTISALDFSGKNMVDEEKHSPIMRFYREKTVFVTGATGFLGILFIEKLLRCKAKTVYVLVRPKKNNSPAERIQQTFTGAIFAILKQIDPDYLSRIKLIEGDTSKADLGISDDDREEIISIVEIVIHAAADVRFDKPLQELCFTNVRGTRALTQLAEQIKNLIVFAYISTAFSQYYREKIEEKFYPPPCDPDEMIRIAEYFEEHQTEELNFLSDKVLEPWANTYVFTKALSEEVVRRVAHKFPTIVIRPSTIISTYEDPIPGWTNNIYGLNGITVGIGLGFIKVAMGNEHSTYIEVVCADFVTNGTLAAMYNKVNGTENVSNKVENFMFDGKDVSSAKAESLSKFDLSNTVVHITSQDLVTCGQMQERMLHWHGQCPLVGALSASSVSYATGIKFIFMTILCHLIPAIVWDAFFRLTNNKIRLLPLYRKYHDLVERTAYFSNHFWQFDHQNMKRIIDNMADADQRYFNCDVFKFKTLEYARTYQLGLRTYIVKEPIDAAQIDVAKRRYRILRGIYYITSTFYYGFLGCLLYMLLHLTGVASYIQLIFALSVNTNA
ncbi:fatty acyl-CoA reductase wat-like isoform X1 [Bradysia coprophila]|uniref:fatty acyl-CoA reductase wat-like isoform X1 n=1 Tax=Bradysia coprophila TaxID=38358 RepID=UPI00187D8568|nr:fatty acyl-CoA reductase wat-like isoform X1 [Bradysia coprophila]